MVQNLVKVGENTYRETYGRYFEDFNVGDTYQHRPGRTISEADNTWFTLLTMNNHPLHFDSEYGESTEFGQVLVNSAFTVALIGGMSVSDVSYKTFANLGWTDIKLTNPVFVGDTLLAESTVLEKRESKSRPTAGIVTVHTRGHKRDGTTVCEYDRTMLIPKRGHGIEDKMDY